MPEDFLHKKLNQRKAVNAFRTLRFTDDKIDFCSNDYLGIVKNKLLNLDDKVYSYGSTGSRLLSGNYPLIEATEKFIADFHDAEAGLIFNSGYDANVGLLSCVPQKGDVIFYDELIHASIRDGIRLSFATSFSFLHNNIGDLEKKIKTVDSADHKNIFIVTESVFSMDGDIALLNDLINLCEKYNASLIIDEAHATGIIGKDGKGIVQHLNLQKKCFARVHTFGKACGAHGAIVLGSKDLKDYLINFSRPFIFSTSLPEVSIAAISASYKIFPSLKKEREHLNELIFQIQNSEIEIQRSDTPIQVMIIPGNNEVKRVAEELQQNNFDVRAIIYPTVPKGKERLRIVLHAFNTFNELDGLINILSK